MMRSVRAFWFAAGALTCLSGCIGSAPQGTTTVEADALPRLRIDVGDDRLVGQGDPATLSVDIRGGKAPYHIRWSQESGPTTQIVSTDGPMATTAPLMELGHLVFRVVVADATGQHASAFAPVEVVPAGSQNEDLVITGPMTIDSDQPVQLGVVGGSQGGGLTYQWTVVSGDGTLSGADTAMPNLSGGNAGDVRVRVEVSDPADGTIRAAETIIHLALRVSVSAPDVAISGMPVALTTSVNADPARVTFEWSVDQGTADIDNPAAQNVMITMSVPESVHLHVTVSPGASESGTQPEEAMANVRLVSIEDTTPEAVVHTSMGDIRLELFYDDAPKTVFNFLRYADDGFYNDLVFHRVIAGFVIQGGGFFMNGEELEARPPTFDPVMSEANNGHSNTIGTIAMALRGTDANSGTSQFFINLGDNNFLDTATANQPAFTVFGHVIAGMDVVDAIAIVPTGQRSGQSDVPIDPVTISAVSRGR
ncbi:MAG TPA: peptidylprolyl isomerase [Phycisphaerae bacterium]